MKHVKHVWQCAVMVALVFVMARVSPLQAQPFITTDNVPRYGIWQRAVTNDNSYGNKFNYAEIELQGTFTSPGGTVINFFGFYDGDGNGGEEGTVWKIRFMPEEVGTYSYSLSFSDGTPIPNPSGQFTVVESTLPGPPSLMGSTPPHSYFFQDARGNPVKWKSYALESTADYSGGYAYWEPEVVEFMNNVIDNQVIAQGYNATILASPVAGRLSSYGFMSEDGKGFHLGCAKSMDLILGKLADEHIWTTNWVAYTAQPRYSETGQDTWGNLYNNRALVMRYFVARWAPFYNYFGWSPTWETQELADNVGRTEAIQKKVIEFSPWEKFPTTHDKALTEWTDWQKLQLRQCQTRTIGGGNNRTADGFSGFNYPIIGTEDLWETCSGTYGHPRNGTEVRHGVWGELLAGVYTMYNEWTRPCADSGNGEGDPYNKIAMDFWYDHTTWYEYTMKNDLVADGADAKCSGWDGQEYVVYDADGGSNSIDLSGVDGSFQLTWLNPLDGTLTPAGTVAGNQTVNLVPPASTSGEWLAFLKTTTAHLPGDVTCDDVVDHADTIVALKIVAESGDNLPTCSPADTDVDGDDRFGLAEAIHTLGIVAQ